MMMLVSGMSGKEDFRRAEIGSPVATVFVLIPMYYFLVCRAIFNQANMMLPLYNISTSHEDHVEHGIIF